MTTYAPTVQLAGISKRFPGGVVANDGVDCEGRAGEIHAILGENGAGKTTLMKILAGLYSPDSGEIRLDGQPVSFRSPKDAARAGVGMVHQQFSLVPALTVAENLALGAPEVGFVFSPAAWSRWLEERASALGFDLRLDAPVWTLSMGERQRVEIFRLLLRHARVLILDEPTSILAPQEAERLFAHLREFTQAGHVVFLVTHKIQHALAVADRVTVLRRGRVVAARGSSALSRGELAELMVGRADRRPGPRSLGRHEPSSRIVLEVRDLSVPPATSPFGIRGMSFQLRAGEILGVAGISGHGQDELIKAVAGAAQGWNGAIHHLLPAVRRAHIPEERLGLGLVEGLSLAENLSLRNFRRATFRRGPFLDRERLAATARERIQRFSIGPADPSARIETLSGGNLQKTVLARELDAEPGLVIAEAPTAGLDFATVDFVHRELVRQAEEGAGVLVVSEDLDELLTLCHRILVIYEGRLAGVFEAAAEHRTSIGLAMSGLDATSTFSALVTKAS